MFRARKKRPDVKNKAVYFSAGHRLITGQKKRTVSPLFTYFLSGFSTGVAEP